MVNLKKLQENFDRFFKNETEESFYEWYYEKLRQEEKEELRRKDKELIEFSAHLSLSTIAGHDLK